MECKISIIIPVFNVQDYIKEALESIVRQTIGFEHLEVILVNDCSTDRSGEIIDEYASKYDNFKAIHLPENSGYAGKPRNIGINEASGKYLMFLDPDDYYEDDACETLYNKIVEEDVDIVFGRYYYILNGKRLNRKSFSPFKDGEIKVNSIDEDKRLFKTSPSVWTKIVKKSFIEENNITFLEGMPGQDAVFVVNMFLKAEGIVYLQNYFPYNYRIRDSNEDMSVSHNRNKNNLMGMVSAYYALFDILKDNKKEEYFPIIFGNHLPFWMRNFILSSADYGEKRELLEYAGPLFEEFKKYGADLNIKYLIQLFNFIAGKKYDEAIIIAEILSDFIEKQNQLENRLDAKGIQAADLIKKQKQLETRLDARKKQVAELQTTLGWLEYKIKNIGQRLKRKMSYVL
ncbi:glycosyltransferase family 2 protein [Methanobacterium sp.]|uniref:glycosyltransferase family 2 protein n=1 Tax=Methanobacterium sp. TaxID=2164 RepID=UPI00315906CB